MQLSRTTFAKSHLRCLLFAHVVISSHQHIERLIRASTIRFRIHSMQLSRTTFAKSHLRCLLFAHVVISSHQHIERLIRASTIRFRYAA